MSDFLKLILLSAVQGITEFLPISSSGHLGLAQHLFAYNPPGILFEITTHTGTLAAVIIYYRKRLVRIGAELLKPRSAGRQEVLFLAVATVPIAVVGVTLGEALTPLFDRPLFISGMLIITGAILLSLMFRSKRTTDLSMRRALLIGLAQVFAILPGISRSGMTITAARHLGLDPKTAAEFSLLLMIPAIGGATLLSAGQALGEGLGTLTPADLITAFAVSCAVGYASIVFLVRELSRGHFSWFGFYCLAAGATGLLLLH